MVGSFCELPLSGVVGKKENLEISDHQDSNRLTILSMGLGQDSTAIAILLATGKLDKYRSKDTAKDVKIVFSDTGMEWPETYAWREEFGEWLKGWGLEILTLEKGTSCNPLPPLDEWYTSLCGIPTRSRRSCTDRHKIGPIRKWIESEATSTYGCGNRKWLKSGHSPHRVLIGIAGEEAQRASKSDVKYADNYFPLLELGLSRMDCQKVIKEAGFKTLPIKSGCVCCPFAPDGWYWALKEKYGNLWARTVEMERIALNKNGKLHLKGSRPISEIVPAWRDKNPEATPDNVIRGVYSRGW